MSEAPNPGILLHHGHLHVLVMPGEGGRIASLLDTRSGVEFLFQPPAPYYRSTPLDLWAPYESSACAGIDDCLPTVSVSGPETPGGPVPDHGDFWRLPCSVLAIANDALTLSTEGYSRPLHMEKTLRLHADSLEIRYTLRNLSSQPVPFLYALHPLLAIDPGDRLLLPPQVTSATLNSSHAHRLGSPGDSVPWPHPHPAIDLTLTQPVTAGTADMLYTPRLTSGWAALYRDRHGQGIIVRFDPRQLPYAGLWLCYGGWPDDPALPRQHAVAFEPTVAPHGSLAAAIAAGQAPVLPPHGTFEFTASLEITAQYPISYEEFAVQCSKHIHN